MADENILIIRIVTSGIEGIFPAAVEGQYPRGLVIGQIESIERSSSGYENVVIRPAVDFSSLEDVLVVLSRPADPVLETADADGPSKSGAR